ncbi:MAG: cytochrome-c oxidase, cbb3-type subunit I [Myxococcales bacterium]|nr:cytochrome-c oxidase, cbb3-type subunit I [Myxococcales bacterium]
MKEVRITYDDGSVRRFMLASMFWGLIGMIVGLLCATQLAFPALNFAPILSFGRLRPLHTNAVIFAFVGNMLFAGVYYSTQRLCKTRLASDLLSALHFYGWQLIIVAAAVTLPLGYSQGKEYAELEWPIDILIALIWVVFAVNFFWTLAIRREKHLFVALWFYISTIITVAVLHIVNSLALPIFSGLKSYSIYAGVQDALVQWWYGHNAVAFFLTTPILGIMYYFLPKAAERPVYSYRLSIVHFWALIFMYIWAGPHHLLYTALPDWAQSMGMVFSVMLWAPSWGGMINGLLTLRGAWGKLRSDPVIKFFIAGVTFYGMATFEGPLLSIKSVSGLAHYTDWIIGHVHTGALGWNGFMAAGMFYFLVPKLWNRPLHSKSLADLHFWTATIGILLYTVSMWISGVTQGLMWKAVGEDGALLYPSFVETLIAIRPMYLTRMVGGTLYIVGFVVMLYNLGKTIAAGAPVETSVTVVEQESDSAPDVAWSAILFSRPILIAGLGLVAIAAFFLIDSVKIWIPVVTLLAGLLTAMWISYAMKRDQEGRLNVHRTLEGRSLIFTALVLLAVLIGGVAEILPTIVIDRAVPLSGAIQQPYRPLELHGRDIYVREGCYVCHSQMVRPFRSEKLRYGDPSLAGEFIYDHPFQWGSKRTGPDLHRVGGKYGNLWHYQHMMDPRATSQGSNMPAYAFLAQSKLDLGDTAVKMSAMKMLGVPYSAAEISGGSGELERQGRAIAADLKAQGIAVDWDSQMVALIAYLQRLGKPPATTTPTQNAK